MVRADTLRDSGSRHFPKELGPERIGLYRCAGRVWPVTEFVANFACLLEPQEQELICGQAAHLAGLHIPDGFCQCLSRSREFALETAPKLVARRSGSRSAHLPDLGLKLKGCRPVKDQTTYPLEVLTDGARQIKQTRIPFGTITSEGVMREVLGWAFHRQYGLPVHATPLCVFEYAATGHTAAFCLVSKTEGENRVEAKVEYPACTVEEMIRGKQAGLETVGGALIGSELKLRGVNLWWYIEEKSRLLCEMHFRGGFRGILNSNIGNDVLLPGANGGSALCLCDFDTFRVMPVPNQPNQAFLNEFVTRAMIEVIKGSLSICDYVEIAEGASVSETAELLGRAYFEKSSLWGAYARRFEVAAKGRGWNMEDVQAAIAEARLTASLSSVLASSVVNSHYLREMAGDRAVFYPHN